MDSIYLGKLVNTHGIKGEVRIQSDFEMPERAFKIGNELKINHTNFKIASYRVHKGFHMVTFEGINNINQILHLKGSEVYLERRYLYLNEDEFLLNDLINMNVYLNDELIGMCTDFQRGLNPLIQIDNIYIPYNNEFIKCVDIKNDRIELTDLAKELI